MSEKKDNPFRAIRPSRVVYPVIIGLGVVAYMLVKEFDPGAFSVITFTWYSALFLFLAIVFMVFRDLGYMIRLHILTHQALTWKQCFRIIMLWEFTSAITPSAIGGTSVAILYVNKEGISLGRSSAVVMATSFLDELYFILMFPLLILIVTPQALFSISGESFDSVNLFANEFFYFAVIGYIVKFLFVLVLVYGLFINPRGLKWLLLFIFRFPFLRRWRTEVNEAGNDIVISSRELRRQSFMFWFKAFGATIFSWTSRYWVVNMLIISFFVIPDHFLVFARQLVMWIMMLVSPTPGGSGFAEYVFTRYLGEFFPVDALLVGSVAVAMALIWRLVSYYPYLIIGAFILPRWLKEKFGKK